MTQLPLLYEIEFDVPGQYREDYNEWVETESIDWIAYEAVGSFQVYHNDQGLSPELKFVFGFESLEKWVDFMKSESTDPAIENLEAITEGLDATLWRQNSLRLNGTAGDVSNDSGRSHDFRSFRKNSNP